MNSTNTNIEKGTSIWTVFEKQCILRPSDTAVIDVDGRVFSFSKLKALVETVQALFPEDRPTRVGIVMDHGVEMIAAMLAVVRSGAAYVAAEPDFPAERVNFMMRQAGVDFIITSPHYSNRFVGYMVLPLAAGEGINPRPSVDASTVGGNAPAYILYTSGTTGTPKGVVVTNDNVVGYAVAFEHEFHAGPGDVMMQFSVCTFDIFTEEVYGSLLNGAALAITPMAVKAGSVAGLMEFARRRGVTMISGFPLLMLDINKSGEELPASLRLLISGGDVLRASYVDRLVKLVDVYNTYGPSETTVCATYFRCNGHRPLTDGTYPIGKPVLGADVKLVDAEGKPVQDGEAGELMISGRGVSLGYLVKCPESSNFITLEDGRRAYLSGDIGMRLPDGNIAFLHRKDTQVMIGGRRVECSEVENVMTGMPEVERAVVLTHEDEDHQPYMTAYVVPSCPPTFSLKKLRAKMAQKLTDFMIPEFFVILDTLPLTPNGKVNKRALPRVMKAA